MEEKRLEQDNALQRVSRLLNIPSSFQDNADDIFKEMNPEIKDYLMSLKPGQWSQKPANTSLSHSDVVALRRYLGYSLARGNLTHVCGVLLILVSPGGHVIEANLLDDVLQYVEEQGSGHVIPAQLLIGWAKLLQNKGDHHGAIRRLKAAQSLLKEKPGDPGREQEPLTIEGQCCQLAGLTLNKMCCWKSAILPLMESVGIFRRSEWGVVSLEMTARCLCVITDGDYTDLQEKLGFQHPDRFYQAYVLCKEAATVAGTSEPMLARVQNQACEALLMYSAQRTDPAQRLDLLGAVTGEAKNSLLVHSTLDRLAGREQFFQFVRSLFLLSLALDFSHSPPDKAFAGCLEERARVLYAEYCRQISQKGFLLQKLEVREKPAIARIISTVKREFGLGVRLSSGEEDELEFIRQEQNSTNSQTKAEDEILDDEFQRRFRNLLLCSDQTRNGEQPGNGHGDEMSRSAHSLEVGLPVDPSDYSIPVYDVPHNIFQDLCGCKFTPSGSGPVNPAHFQQPGIVQSEDTERKSALTEDSGYGPSIVLANTFLTTKLPDTRGTALPYNASVQSHRGNVQDYGDSVVRSSLRSSSTSSTDQKKVVSDSAKVKPRGPVPSNSVRRARLLKFNPVTGLWTSQTTLVFVGDPLPLQDKDVGKCRDAFNVQFLHQDEVMGRYVGKRYKRQRPPSQYLQDVTCQKTARFLVTLFNYALNDLRYDIQVVYVPVAHVQLLSRDSEEVEDWLNVEPYLEGDFVKLTNNLSFCNSQGRTLATALTHFTYSVSDGRLMLVDLQGWLPREGRGVVYLTDPQFHTRLTSTLSACDLGARGMKAFWDNVHPECNAICHALQLKRPE